jgi:hypothetical protein
MGRALFREVILTVLILDVVRIGIADPFDPLLDVV